ncbi:MAG: glycosyltransferase [Candidatus Thermoplasmatota archaeon]|nr:glycosyltransferase [Candidatus Thermoplasmatota archaeon]
MKIIYAVCSWGLGHATRSLPVIRKLAKDGNELTIISHGRALKLLKDELGENPRYIEIEDYPILISENARQFMAKSMVYWPTFISKMIKGQRKIQKILEKEKYDRIISDGRYDIYSKRISSFFISHQIRIMNPLRIKMFERGSEIFNLFFFKRFCGVIVPDYSKDNLSGDLSHNLHRIDENKIHYAGVLSDFKKINKTKNIDYLISISGPEPQRTMLEEKLLTQIGDLKGKVVVTLGKTENLDNFKKDGVETYSFLPSDKREEFLNRAKLVVSRCGYSTILDLAVIGTKALMIPTPGQVEQEYLAEYHNKKGSFFCVNQNKIDLSFDVEMAKKRTGITRRCDVDESVENIINIVMSNNKSPFR